MTSLSPLATRAGWGDPGEAVEARGVGDAPGLDGAEVSVVCRQADGRVAVLAPGAEPVDELPAPGLAGGGLLEEYGQQVLGYRGVLVCGERLSQGGLIRKARGHDRVTLSRIFPPRSSRWIAAWMFSRSNTAATGTNRAPLATKGAASRMTGSTFVA